MDDGSQGYEGPGENPPTDRFGHPWKLRRLRLIAEGVHEMRIHYGPGYRLYFTRREQLVYLLLIGGDKGSQKRDIRQAIEMARNL